MAFSCSFEYKWAQMEYRLLGPLEVRVRDVSLPLGGAKQRALLALLHLHANRVVAREPLIDALWGERPPEPVVKSVQLYISRRCATYVYDPGRFAVLGVGARAVSRCSATARPLRKHWFELSIARVVDQPVSTPATPSSHCGDGVRARRGHRTGGLGGGPRRGWPLRPQGE